MYDIICYGTICQDRIIRIPRYPEAGGSVWIESDELRPGGEAVNSAIAWDRWGLSVLLLGTVLGRDDRAQWMLEELGNLVHVDASLLTASHRAETPYCLILATPDAERTMFGRHFREMQGQPVDHLPKARVFTLDPYCGENAARAARVAREQGMRVVAMDAVDRPDVASCADLVVTSYQEILSLVPDGDVRTFAARAAREMGRMLVLTLGPEGSEAYDRDGKLVHRQPAVAVPEDLVVDATGCGDVYRAGLVCGEAMGWPLSQSMAFASAAAACNLTAAGGGAGVRSLDETLEIAALGRLDGPE
ncbi:MAG: ribokinase [Armatimonadota bacterium]|nr:MAG: ribokinase [Armatimonadota bacterium]